MQSFGRTFPEFDEIYFVGIAASGIFGYGLRQDGLPRIAGRRRSQGQEARPSCSRTGGRVLLIGAVVLTVVLLVLLFAISKPGVRKWLARNNEWLEPTAYLAAVVTVFVTVFVSLATYR